MDIAAYMLSCPARESTRQQTLANLATTDWDAPVSVQIDTTTHERLQQRLTETAFDLLRHAVDDGPDFILFLEDDLNFNRHLRHNLASWYPLLHAPPGGHFFASLYNPTVQKIDADTAHHFLVVHPESVYGSQAFLLSAATARHILNGWETLIGMGDIKMPRLAAQRSPLFYHQPSLVQHTGVTSSWGGRFHTARDFDPLWQADPQAGLSHAGILSYARSVEGWLDDAEAHLLIDLVCRAAAETSTPTVVEIGSYCGKTTVLCAGTLRHLGITERCVHSLDRHDGVISVLGGRTANMPPTWDKFCRNIADAGVAHLVHPMVGSSHDIEWSTPIDLLYIDGLRDEASVAADFSRFAPHLKPRGVVAFHDVAPHFPAVHAFVKSLLASGAWQRVGSANSLVALAKA